MKPEDYEAEHGPLPDGTVLEDREGALRTYIDPADLLIRGALESAGLPYTALNRLAVLRVLNDAFDHGTCAGKNGLDLFGAKGDATDD